MHPLKFGTLNPLDIEVLGLELIALFTPDAGR